MPQDSGILYSGGPFRRLAAFNASTEKALKMLRERRDAELSVKKFAVEDNIFGAFLKGGAQPDGDYKPFNPKNLPNVAMLGTSKRYAPIIDAMLGVENLRLRERQAKDGEYDDLLNRYNAETARMKVNNDKKTTDTTDKVLVRQNKITLSKAKVKKEGLQKLVSRKYPKLDLDGLLAKTVEIPQVPVTKFNPDTGNYEDTGAVKYDPDVEDYIQSIGQFQQEMDNQELPYEDAFLRSKGIVAGRPQKGNRSRPFHTAPTQQSPPSTGLFNTPVHQDSSSVGLFNTPVHQDSSNSGGMFLSSTHQDSSATPTFSAVAPYVAEHESAGGTRKVNLNNDGSVDAGKYQINSRNLDRKTSGGKLADALDPIFKKYKVGGGVNERVEALISNDKLNYEVAQEIYNQRGIKQWSSHKKIVGSFNAANQPKVMRTRITKDIYGLKAGTMVEVPPDKFDASYMEKVQ